MATWRVTLVDAPDRLPITLHLATDSLELVEQVEYLAARHGLELELVDDLPPAATTTSLEALQGLVNLVCCRPYAELRTVGDGADSPWLLVELGHRADARKPPLKDHERRWTTYAIWKATGAVHEVGADGAVKDPPLLAGVRS